MSAVVILNAMPSVSVAAVVAVVARVKVVDAWKTVELVEKRHRVDVAVVQQRVGATWVKRMVIEGGHVLGNVLGHVLGRLVETVVADGRVAANPIAVQIIILCLIVYV